MNPLEASDYKKIARRRVPKMFFDYVDSGAYTEATYKSNGTDLEKVIFKPRVGRNLANRTISCSMVGQKSTMPLALAPTGITGFQRADGEILAARAAQAFGIPFTLSTMSNCSIEEVAKHTSQPFWFQLYVMKDRGFVKTLIQRAKAVGCTTLVATLDLQLLGQRHKDLRNGLGSPPSINLKTISQLASRPIWCAQMLRTKNRFLGNIVGHARGANDLRSMSAWVADQFDLEFCWDDIAWLRKHWDGKLILKGIMCVEDANFAADVGADAVIVSNHGGRQLDGAPSTISVLGPIVDAVGDRVEVHVDGGIDSGQDVMRAIAMGAKGTYIGRAFLFALGAHGEKGVHDLLNIIAKELDITMALCGERNIADVGRQNLLAWPKQWGCHVGVRKTSSQRKRFKDHSPTG